MPTKLIILGDCLRCALLHLLLHQRSLSYFERYLSTVRAIHNNRSICWPRVGIWLRIGLLCYQSARALYLSSVSLLDSSSPSESSSSLRAAIVAYNLPTLMSHPRLNLGWACLGLMAAIFFRQLYLRADSGSCSLIEQVLFSQKCPLFVNSPSSHKVYRTIRSLTLRLLNLLQLFLVCMDFNTLYMHLVVMGEAVGKLVGSTNTNTNHLSWTEHTVHLVNGALYHFVLYEFTLVAIQGAAVGTVLTILFVLRMRTTNRMLLAGVRTRHKRTRSIFGSIDRFRADLFGQVLPRFMQANRWLGPVFTTFLVLNTPLNAYLMAWLMATKEARLMIRALLGVLVGAQLFCNLLLHLVFSHFARLIHRPARVLCSMMANSCKSRLKPQDSTQDGASLRVSRDRSRRCWCWCRCFWPSLYQLSSLVEALHSSSSSIRFGMTYGGCGLITLASFGRTLAIYGKLCMMNYKLHRSSEIDVS